MKRDKVAGIYDRQTRPVTKNPDQLETYPCHRFSIAQESKLVDIGFRLADALRHPSTRRMKM